MPLTVLFDLDDTLLHTNTYQFFPAYFKALGESLSQFITHEKAAKQIGFAVQQMQANRDPAKLLSEVFAENFFLSLNTHQEACQEELLRFYHNEFPKLQDLTDKNPKANELVKWCLTQDMNIAVATDPLFPEIVTSQRMEWAGLVPEDFIFISTMDNFHFTKPNLTYYAESLGRLGWPKGGAVMIGDSIHYDLLPMETMGLPTFWVSNESGKNNRSHGLLSDVRPWLNQASQSEKSSISEVLEVHLAILQSTPAVFDSWLREIPESILRRKPAESEWSVLEVLWHLADMENEVFNPQWEQILSDPAEPVIPPDTSQWAKERYYQTKELSPALCKFMDARLDSLSKIDRLIEKDMLSNSIQHSILSHAEISELIGFVAKHDRIHLHQCFNLLDSYKIY